MSCLSLVSRIRCCRIPDLVMCRVGSAVFSLSYLYFSEEHFCCSLEHCHEVFLTQSEAEAHWLDVHADSALPDTETGSEAYSHSYRSCSINIPIVSADTSGGLTDQSSQRRGSIRVSAYLEDTGQLTEKRIFAQKAGYVARGNF